MLIHDLMLAGSITVPPRPAPAPACSDAEPLAIAEVRHLLAQRSEAGFRAEVARDWAHLCPVLPHRSEANRRTRRLRGAFEQFRATLAARLPEMTASRWTPGRHPPRRHPPRPGQARIPATTDRLPALSARTEAHLASKLTDHGLAIRSL